ncbi:malectin domain-containing carbohydrate-binding protein, partial [Pontibacter sp. BT731]|uniref:malectin domain-containing carbohydrate-binding protein n=1 Tax=Pontibacter coccineus TaxID=3063328 RepID=UPI0026E15E88
ISPYYGTASQQAGLWFGLNDKTYVKLVVVGNKVELRREVNDASGSADQRTTSAISGINTSSVRLRLQVDPAAGTVQGFYALNGGAEQSVGTALSISGTGLTSTTAFAGVFATHRNGSSPVTYTLDDFSVTGLSSSDSLRPYVTAVRPQNGATNVSLDQSISVDLAFPSGKSLDGGTVNPSTVKLYTVINGVKSQVSGTAVNATAAGDAITLTATLKTSTTYEFEITEQVKDLNGYSIIAFKSTFTTTSSTSNTPPDLVGVSFTEKVLIDNSFGSDGFTSLVIGPDHRLYATTSGGKIERWDINADGTLANYRSISPFGSNRRLLVGIRFAHDASSSNLIAWISHSSPEFENVPDWTSKISKVNLNNPASPIVKDYVVNLPRSIKDHSINSIDIGPDGALYITIGSNTAMGAPDPAWGNRPDRTLSAAVLRLDIAKADQQTLPIDARTKEGGGSYNPFSTSAPLTLYATGLRNAYDLVWHTNGQLYVPTNGSAAGGNTPALKSGSIWSNGSTYTGPDIPAMVDVRDTQSDYLFRVLKGGYYGHPNVLRNEYILNGGNPTSKEDPGEVVWTVNGTNYGYPVGTPTEPKYRGWSYDFGTNKSPNGVIEYKSNAFDGKLTGKLLVCRFSGGDDIIILEPGGTSKDIIRAVEGSLIPGLRRPFSNPLDVIEDVRTGNLYISEYFDGNGNGQPRITLLKADKPASSPSVDNGLINSGGGQYTDSQSRTWGADAGFSGGVTGAKSFDVAGTTDDGLYLSYRYATNGGPFSYNIPVSGTGPHTVRLHFLEPYFGAPGGKTSGLAGARVFHIDIEGTRVLSNYDIYSQDGAGKAIVKTFQNVAVSDGALTVSFASVTNNAIISAIEVISASGTIAIKSNLETQEGEEVNHKKHSSLHIYPNPNHGGDLFFEIRDFGELETVELTLFDMAGRSLHKDLAITDAGGFATGKIIIQADLSPGMYLIKAQSKSISKTTKFIKQ